MANLLKIFYLILLAMPLYAKDFGTHGHTFPIEEEDLLEYLKHKLRSISSNELEHLEESIKQHYIKMAKEPISLELQQAQEYRVYYFDPSITTSKDIIDHQGKVIVAKGSQTNPLTLCPMRGELLFLDGSNETHLQWARRCHPTAKWILVKGRPLELEEKEGRAIYFDQFGFLTSKLAIKHIPAKVSQEKGALKLKIEEMPLCKSY